MLMNLSDDEAQNGVVAASAVFLRYVLPSMIAVLLLVGGVIWLHQLPAAGSHAADSPADVQVQLLRTPDPTPIPVQKTHQLSTQVTHPSPSPQDQPTPSDLDDNVAPLPPSSVTTSAEPVAVPATASLQPPSDPSSQTAVKFEQTLLRHIAHFQHYPAAARRAHLEGTVHVAFVMRRDGTIVDAWIQSSSGEPVLDQEALDTIRRAEPLPVIPNELPEPLNVQLPVAFAFQ